MTLFDASGPAWSSSSAQYTRLWACTVPDQELGPVQVERHGGYRRGRAQAQGREGRSRARSPHQGVSDAVVDELRVGARRERQIFRLRRKCESPGARSRPPASRRSSRCHRAGVPHRRTRPAALAAPASLAILRAPPISPAAEGARAAGHRLVSFSLQARGVNRFAAERARPLPPVRLVWPTRRLPRSLQRCHRPVLSLKAPGGEPAPSGSDTRSARRLCSCRRRSAEAEP